MEGVDVLVSKLAALEKAMDTGAKRGVAEQADRAATDAESMVPVDSGALAGTIRTEQSEMSASVVAGDDSIDYPGYVEFGTSRTPAQPFMRPAADRQGNEAESKMSQVRDRAIAQVAH
jgi:HK97 gp10 family phage protein